MFFSPAPDLPNLLNGTYNNIMFSDYEQQTLILFITEYLGLTLAVHNATVSTYIPPKYSQVAIQILDNDSKQLITQRSNILLIMNQKFLVIFEHFSK